VSETNHSPDAGNCRTLMDNEPMPLRYGTCTNFGLCGRADTREAQNIPDGAAFVCQECKRSLVGLNAGGGASSRVLPVIGVLFFLVLIGGAVFYFFRLSPKTAADANAPTAAIPGSATPTSGVAPIVRLSGSNTIGAELGPALAEAWLASKNATNVHRERGAHTDEVRIAGAAGGQPLVLEVKAHGSATAFTDLGSGACDIGMASRKITTAEAAGLLTKAGDLTSNANEKVLGLDGVAVIVNEAGSTDAMTKNEVAQIFSGASTGKSWHLYARDDKSGTYDTFRDRVLGTRTLDGSAKRIEDSRALVTAVAQDRDGIGFVGLPYAVGVKVLAISEKGALPLVPNAMTVRTESYPLSRRLYLYLPDSAKPEAREFVRFALSSAGQDVVEKSGFVGQKIEVMTSKAPASGPQGYVQLMPQSDRLSVDFRFRPGSSTLDTKAVDDVNRVATAMASQYSKRGVILVGFADNTGGAAANLGLSKERAEAVAQQMRTHGVTPVLVTGFGQELPVADNSTEDGRQKNRRVEAWLQK
jgi:phosphate transport system substrate-binding protein